MLCVKHEKPLSRRERGWGEGNGAIVENPQCSTALRFCLAAPLPLIRPSGTFSRREKEAQQSTYARSSVAARASASIAPHSPAATRRDGVSHEPPTQATLGVAR